MKINSNLPAINGFQEFKTELEGLLDLASTNGGVATAPFDVIYSADGISLRQDGVDKWLVGPSEYTAGVVDRSFLSKNSIPTSLSDRTVVKSSSMTFSAVKGAVPVSFSTVRYFSLSDPNVFVSGGPFSPISSFVANTALGGPGTIQHNGATIANASSTLIRDCFHKTDSNRVIRISLTTDVSATTQIKTFLFRYTVAVAGGERLRFKVNGTFTTASTYPLDYTSTAQPAVTGGGRLVSSDFYVSMGLPFVDGKCELEIHFTGIASITCMGTLISDNIRLVPTQVPRNKTIIISTDANNMTVDNGGDLMSAASIISNKLNNNTLHIKTSGCGYATTSGSIKNGYGQAVSTIGNFAGPDLISLIKDFGPSTVIIYGSADTSQIISETSFPNSVASTLGLLRSELGDNVKILCVNNSFVSDAVSFDQSQIVLSNVLKTVCDSINNCEFIDMLGLSEIVNLNSWVFTTTYPNGSIVKHNSTLWKCNIASVDSTKTFMSHASLSGVAGYVAEPGLSASWVALGVAPPGNFLTSIVSGGNKTIFGAELEALFFVEHLAKNKMIVFN